MIGTLDIIFAIVIVVAAVRCLVKGLVAEISMVAALFLGLGGALLLMRPGARLLTRYTGIETAASVIAFLIIFIVIYLVVKISEGLLHRLFDALRLEKLDKVLGFFLGLAEGLLVCAIAVFVMSIQPFFEVDELLGNSILARFLLPLIPGEIRLPRPGALQFGEVLDV